ncbi:MAG: 16S rRNA (guanine(966)-N(2))-methyltransferase RsmD [Candidatus Omnitrophica bacterium]|nr:16S rRNA (guanine(966)-N(2))-methyltransferase RsmD [Candidatus Omnitrophota bacterium]
MIFNEKKLRIIGGSWRGKKLKIKKGLEVQPTKDRVREALFDILGDLKKGNFLDLYAGLGTVGLEALSRGAKEVVFAEKEKRCVAVIERNLNELGVRERTEVYCLPVEKVLTILSKNGKKFKFIFLDPPYSILLEKLKGILEMVRRYRLLSDKGVLILEHRRGKDIPEAIEPFYLTKQKQYGRSTLSFYKLARLKPRTTIKL